MHDLHLEARVPDARGELHEAAGVRGHEDLGARPRDVRHLAVEEGARELGARDVVDPGAPAGRVGLGERRDAQFRVDREGNNAVTGRFTPYWTRDENGHIAVQPLVEYDSSERHPNGVLKGGWYITPRDDHRESVLGPLPYIVQGKKVWLATMSVPILVDGKFYGVAGADYNLDFVQKLARKVHNELFDGKGQVSILADQGLLVAQSEHPEMIGGPLKQVMPEGWEEVLKAVQDGRAMVHTNDKTGMIETVSPIHLGQTGKPWSVLIQVPEKIVLAKAMALDDQLTARGQNSAFWQIVAGVAVIALAVVLLWLASGGIAKPIRRAAELADVLRAGDFSQRPHPRPQAGGGQACHSLHPMADTPEAPAASAD